MFHLYLPPQCMNLPLDVNILFNNILPGWFQTTLYTRVLAHVTKKMKIHQFCGSHFSINMYVFFLIILLHSVPFQKYIGVILKTKIPILIGETCTTILSVFEIFNVVFLYNYHISICKCNIELPLFFCV